jgi:hypothetical protein
MMLLEFHFKSVFLFPCVKLIYIYIYIYIYILIYLIGIGLYNLCFSVSKFIILRMYACLLKAMKKKGKSMLV